MRLFLYGALMSYSLLSFGNATAEELSEGIKVVPEAVTSKMCINLSPLVGKLETKHSGVRKSGGVYGLRGIFSSTNSDDWYMGGELGYRAGSLKGSQSNYITVGIVDPATRIEKATIFSIKGKPKSDYSNFWGELRLGYTFSKSLPENLVASPFLIVGYDKDKHNLTFDTSLKCKESSTANYFGFGAVSSYLISENSSIGLNFKIKWSFNSQFRSETAPTEKKRGLSDLKYYSFFVEVPVKMIAYDQMTFDVAPFYEVKNYQDRNTTFEKSDLKTFGAMASLNYLF